MCHRLAVALLLLAAMSRAGVEIKTEGKRRVVKAGTYEATVAGDGCVTNLKVGGVEFLAPGVQGTRGSYIFLDRVRTYSSVRKSRKNQIVAKSDVATMRYRFDEEGMQWELASKSKKLLVLFLVLDASVDAVAGPDGRVIRTVVNQGWKKATFFRDQARLEITGIERQWGPWAGPHQVCELRVPPGENRTLIFRLGTADNGERRALVALRDPFGGGDVLVRSPRLDQVVQRRTELDGVLRVSGRVRMAADAVQVSFTGKPRRGKLPEGWLDVTLDTETHTFAGKVVLPAGGWYRMFVRALVGGEPVATHEVERFGIGEVFVGAGQSNSTNSGQFKTTQKSGLVSSFNGTAWRRADDPQWGTHDRSGGGSFWPAFGDAMVARLGVPIGVAVTGHGGTSVNRWQPDGDLFGWMMGRIHQLGPGGFRALLWHQGESDVGMQSDVYFMKLKTLIEESKAHAGWEFPWFVAQVSYHNPKNPLFTTTRDAQARLWREGVALRGPDTDTLTGDHRDHEGKGIHFSPKGLAAHGRMWADCVGPHVERCLGGDGAGG